MLATRRLAQSTTAFTILLALSARAHGEHFDFNSGVGDDLTHVDTAVSGTPYSWYYQGITLNYGGGYTDGRENESFHDDPYGAIPYFIFDGTDRSTAGHCLQVAFEAADSTAPDTSPVESFRFSTTDNSGNEVVLLAGPSVTAPYTIVRMWIQNTGGGLYWHFKMADVDPIYAFAWNQSALMNIWRLELNQADCTANAVSKDPSLVWTTLIGTTGNYNICVQNGSNQTNGIPPVCSRGG